MLSTPEIIQTTALHDRLHRSRCRLPGAHVLPFSERLTDHHAILDGYLTTLITRNYSARTRQSERSLLYGRFSGHDSRSHTLGRQ